MANTKISINAFCEKHGITTNSFHMHIHINKDCEAVDRSAGKKNFLIDDSWFIVRRNFKYKVHESNLNMFYAISDLDIPIGKVINYICSKTELSKSSLNSFFSQNIWRLSEKDTILKYKIGKVHWLVYLFLGRYHIEEVLVRIGHADK